MKVLVVAPEVTPSSGGVQRYSAALVRALSEVLGSENVEVHSLIDSSESPIEFDGAFYGASGIRFSFSARLAYRCLIRRPDFIWFTHANLSPLGNWLLRLLGIPYAVSAHGVEVWKIKKHSVRQAVKRAAFVCSVSAFTAGILLRRNLISATQNVLLPNTVDEKRFWFSPEIAGKDSHSNRDTLPFTLLTINRFEQQESYKGYRVVLQAFPEIVAAIPTVRWIVGGTGNDLEPFRAEVERLGFSDRILLPGFIPEKDLPRYYREADLFVMPSVLEGFGIVYLEAMCCGTPCLAGNADGAREPLQNGALGFCVDPYSPKDIASAVISFWKGESSISSLSSEDLRRKSIAKYGSAAFNCRLKRFLTRFFDAR